MNRPAPVMPPPLDVVAALARAGRLLLAELPALLMAGLVLVMLPAVAARAFALEGDWPTLVTTLRALAAMIFVAMARSSARWRGHRAGRWRCRCSCAKGWPVPRRACRWHCWLAAR